MQLAFVRLDAVPVTQVTLLSQIFDAIIVHVI